MTYKNSPIQFYLTTDKRDKSRYNICNIYTDHLIRESCTLEESRQFLANNEPTHPFLTLNSLRVENPILFYQENNDQAPTLYSDYYTTCASPAIGSLNYVVSINESCNNLSNSLDIDSDACGDSDSYGESDASGDSDSDSYGDSNHLPYIPGKIMYPGD